QGECDVVVCDGFVGNIVLKVAEGLSEQIMGILFESFSALAGEESGGSPFKDDLRRFAASLDYAEYGGAPLLGVDGIALIGHGRSDEKAVANALRWAHRIATARINECIVEAVKGTDQE
ncbi:MAG: phosphate--acyl-ACP acyltransferase, partial [Planctomycetota bacterium]